MENNLDTDFFNQPTLTVAKKLLGVELLFKSSAGITGGVISETEGYTQDDPACHAFGGRKTKRNAPMFLSSGHIYIYFIYGMYHCLNFVTEPENIGAAVLIRELIPTTGIEIIKQNRPKIKKIDQLLNGPSKLMMGLNIPSNLNGTDLNKINSPILLKRKFYPKEIVSLPRIGISKGKDRHWRFKTMEMI